MYQDGNGGFVPDELIDGAPVFVLGQNPGEEEEKEGRPFIGKTGQAMMADFFPAGGLIRGENVSIGNLIKCRLYTANGKGTNNLPTGNTLKAAVTHCTNAHLHIPLSTRLVVAQGAHAWKYASGTDYPISEWRGFLAPHGLNTARDSTRRDNARPKQMARKTRQKQISTSEDGTLTI